MTGPANKNLLSSFGDEPVHSFEKLFHIYYQRLFLFARKFVDDDTAGDVLQDLFYSIWQDRQKNRIIRSPENYLFAMVRHQCFQHLKQRHTSNLSIDLQIEELRFFDSGESILQFDLENRINELFDSLSPRSRDVFLLSRRKGLSNKEIAEQLNISMKAVEKHITISIKHFKKALQESYPELFVLFLLFFPEQR